MSAESVHPDVQPPICACASEKLADFAYGFVFLDVFHEDGCFKPASLRVSSNVFQFNAEVFFQGSDDSALLFQALAK